MKLNPTNPLRGLALAGLASLALMISAGIAEAQTRWQATYEYNTWDAGRGVVVMDDGGTAMVGSTGLTSASQVDIYLVRTGECEVPLWEYAYDIGGNDYGNRIRRTPDGGFIIVGTTENLYNCRCDIRNDIFLLKLDANGAVQWSHIYGGENREEGRDVRVLNDGYIISGITESYGAGGRDGYLIRTDINGVPIWANSYGGVYEDFFTSCNIATNGDILAAGMTFSFSSSPTEGDIYLVRVNPTTGAPVFTYHYGGTQNDIAWSVVDLGTDLVVAGGTLSYGGNSEAFLLRTTMFGFVTDMKTIGGEVDGGGWDEFLDMAKDPSGNLYVTGIFYEPSNGWGNYDVLVGIFDHNFNLLYPAAIHGDTRDDEGWGIALDPGGDIVVTGLTTSFRFTPSDMYGLRQTIFGSTGCHDRFPELDINRVFPQSYGVFLDPEPGVIHCPVLATRGSRDTTHFTLCTECGDNRRILSGSDPTPAGNDAIDAEALTLTIYPNPITNQRVLTLEYQSAEGEGMELTISDMSGAVILKEHRPAGESRVEIDTKDWPAGSYMVQAKTGSKTSMQRVVVIGE